MPSLVGSEMCIRDRIFPYPLAWVFGSGIIRPKTNAPHWVQGAGFGQPFIASAQRWCFMAGFCVNLAWLPDNTAFCFSLSQTVESKLRTLRPMRLCVLGSGEDMMSSTARWSLKSLAFSGHHKLFRARIWHAVHDKRRRGPMRKIRRGMPEQHHIVSGIFERRIKSRRCQLVGCRDISLGL